MNGPVASGRHRTRRSMPLRFGTLILAAIGLGAGMGIAQAQLRPGGFDGERKRDPSPNTVPVRPSAVLPPYRLQVSPAAETEENQPIQLQPVPNASANLAQGLRSCTITIRPDGGTGNGWQGPVDTTCAQLHLVRMPVGAYWMKLAMRWQASGDTAPRDDTHELPYKVRVGDRLRLQGVRVEPAQPQPRTAAKVGWELVNTGPVTLSQVAVEVHRDGSLAERRVIGALQPGAVWRDSHSFTADEGQRVRFAVVADAENRSTEPEAHRANNRAEATVDMLAPIPPTPVLVVGPVETPPGIGGARPSTFGRAVTICNVDPSAFYRSESSGPQCMPMPCGRPYSGVPNRDFAPGRFRPDGTSFAPACPPGLAFPAGLNPGLFTGPIGRVNEHHFELTVYAEKNGRRSPPATVRFSVPPNCRPPTCIGDGGSTVDTGQPR